MALPRTLDLVLTVTRRHWRVLSEVAMGSDLCFSKTLPASGEWTVGKRKGESGELKTPLGTSQVRDEGARVGAGER